MSAFFHCLSILVLSCCACCSLEAASALALQRVVSGVDDPVDLQAIPGDDQRLLVVEKGGRIRVIRFLTGAYQGPSLRSSPLLSLDVVTENELGLLGLACHPDFASNGQFFVCFAMNDGSRDTLVRRYRVSNPGAGVDTDLQLAAGWVDVLRIPQDAGSAVHRGAWLGFNPALVGDAQRRHHLYIALGDGGAGGFNRALSTGDLRGSILRIDVDPSRFGGPGQPAYGIPGDNPGPQGRLFDTSGFDGIGQPVRGEILAMGLRHPWRCGFDRATGDLWIAEVGQRYEELNILRRDDVSGVHFGWPAYDGPDGPNGYYNDQARPVVAGVNARGGFTAAAYHEDASAFIGGRVYRGSQNGMADWRGVYIHGDWNHDPSGLRAMQLQGDQAVFVERNLRSVVDAQTSEGFGRFAAFGEDNLGQLYACDFATNGSIWRFVPAGISPARITSAAPGDQAVDVGATFTHQVTASGNPDPEIAVTVEPDLGVAVYDAASGLISWTPSSAQAGRSYRFTIAATNSEGGDVQQFTLQVLGIRPADLPLTAGDLSAGMLVTYVDDPAEALDRLPVFASTVADASGQVAATSFVGNAAIVDALAAVGRSDDDWYALRWNGYFKAEQQGSYTFAINSDDGSRVRIGGTTVVAWDGRHGGGDERQGARSLEAGWHALQIEFFEAYGGELLAIDVILPDGTRRALDASLLAQPSTPYGRDHYAGAQPYLGVFPSTLDAARLPPTLSATGAFSDVASLAPSDQLLPFTVNSPLWSDGAVKTRWAAIPAGQQVGYSRNDNWAFPAGSVMIKHFVLQDRPIETRFLVVNGSASYGVTYVWRADGSEADLLLPSDEHLLSQVVPGQDWQLPTRSDCMSCHTAASGRVLGPRTRQLNGAFRYPDTARSDNQLRTWQHLGLLPAGSVDPQNLDALPRLVSLADTAASTELRMQSYLDANCMSCHQPDGPAGFTAFGDARFPSDLQVLVGRSASQVTIDGDQLDRVVVAGDHRQSVLYRRLATVGDHQMPPLGRLRSDAAGTALVAEWIDGQATGNRPPNVVLTATPTSGLAPLTVHLDASASSDPDGDSLMMVWDFADGSGATGPSLDHVFTSPGSYLVSLTVSDGQGAAVSKTITITVQATNTAPVARFTLEPATGQAPLSVAVDAAASSDADGDSLQYRWDFGDGGTAVGVQASHVYTSAGTYQLSLVVSDGRGGGDSFSQTVTVSQGGGEAVLAINIAGPAAQAAGIAYGADPGVGGVDRQLTAAIGGTADDALYQSYRFGDVGYSTTVPPGDYLLVLHAAETFFADPGQRVFDVLVNGTVVVDDLDLVAATGGRFIAWRAEVPISISDGTFQLSTQASANNPLLAAMALVPAGGVVNHPPTVAAGADQELALGEALQLTGSVVDDGLLQDPPAHLWSLVEAPLDAIVTIADPTALATAVGVDRVGRYVFALAADDGQHQVGDEVVVTVVGSEGLRIAINYQPAAAPQPDGWLVDAGAAFADRGNGQTYGWDTVNDHTRDRNSPNAIDQVHDTLNHMQKDGSRIWELALPAGTYRVELHCGDPSYSDQDTSMVVEGQVLGDPDPFDHEDVYDVLVTVDDGRLTITPAAPAANAKIQAIIVTAMGGTN